MAKRAHICYNTRRSPAKLGKDRMTRPMRKLELIQLVRREARTLLKLSPWLLASLLLAAVMWCADLTTTSGLFQSPPEITDTPLPPAPEVTFTPTLTPTWTPTGTLPPPVELTPSVEPTIPLTPTEVSATPTLTPTELAPTSTPSPSPTSEAGEPEPTEDESQRYADQDVDLEYEWSMLFDSVALGVSYLWLCCGVLVFLGIPVFFIVLWVASNRRKQGGE